MSLITPDFGLLFWMVVIFGIVFFLLAKFGFPVITKAVQTRSDHIADSLKAADEAQARLAGLAQEQAKMIEETRLEQSRILKEASESRERIIAQAKEEAAAEAAKLLDHAKVEIAAERESAIRDIRRQVAMISVEVAEKIVRKDLEGDAAQQGLIDRMVDEAAQAQIPN
ncbi:ATP synthase F0 subcomplex B subunit [Bacteroidales bacterium WCE2004]|nr:F0F1 ATP synthase subunit B [Bacteroidales bacterium]SKC63525.1 ATP synthase F0 subcomplex B subunit [Bacteroidales bacterium WCE2004]